MPGYPNNCLIELCMCVCDVYVCSCEAGDLAGKFGPLMPGRMLDEIDNTSTLFLRDQYSIIGRSVVIHQHGDGSNFECGTIRSVAEMQPSV